MEMAKFRYYGHYFGYPECCIKMFEENRKQNMLFKDFSEIRQKAAIGGFVPCETCAEGMLSGTLNMVELIQSKRRHWQPFPKGGRIRKISKSSKICVSHG